MNILTLIGQEFRRIAWNCAELRGIAWNCAELRGIGGIARNCVEMRGIAWSLQGSQKGVSKIDLRWKPASKPNSDWAIYV